MADLDLSHAHPSDLWKLCREGTYAKTTPGVCQGYVQANMAILPKEQAFDFLLFCTRNPKPCPILDVTEPGNPEPKLVAPGADLRTDVPRYCVYEKGRLVDTPTDITSYWRDDLVSFLFGCSYSFERALLANDIPLHYLEEGVDGPVYISNIECTPAGMFHGPMVVSMRSIPHDKVVRAVQVTSRFPWTHGAPVHIGDPAQIGVKDINKTDFNSPVAMRPGEVPVFWACGITPQVVAMHSQPELMITHFSAHMFVTTLKDEQLAVL